MTVATTLSRNRFVGNDVTDEFDCTFRIFDEEDLAVTIFDTDNIQYPQTLNVDFTVSAITGSGFTVTTTSPVTADYVIVIERDLSYVQGVDYQELETFPAEIQETALDYLTMLIQQVKDIADRGIKVSGAADEEPEYEMPPPEAGKVIRGNTAEDGWENATVVGAGDITIPVTIAEGGTQATTASAARTNLGLGTAAVLATGTGAGDLPKNSDLGTAAVLNVGTGAGNIVQLDGSSRLPAVSGRNLTEIRSFFLLADQAVGSAAFYDFTSLAEYDNYLIEAEQLGHSAAGLESFLELYVGGTLIGTGGTTGKFDYNFTARVLGSNTPINGEAQDALQLTPTNYVGLYSASEFYSARIQVRNSYRVFGASGTVRDYPRIQWVAGGDHDTAPRQWGLYGANAQCNVGGASITGFRLKMEGAGTFEGGRIRVYGYNGPISI